MSLSLYVHIPFCLKRCVYCDFVSGIYDSGKAVDYVTALKKEIRGITNAKPLSTLYIGGGTPTALSTDILSGLIDNIFNHFRFIDNYEATIEANPGTVDSDKMKIIRSAGINRISIGVQSFNDEELSFLGRIHTRDEAEQAVYLSREAGFKNVGIDLIYGLPGQSIERWKKTLKEAVSLRPEHISTYELTMEKGTTLDKMLKITSGANNLKPLDEDKIIDMYNHTIDHLTSSGYIHYEISNFATPGHSCKHNLNFWDRKEYRGTGTGAHSFMEDKRFYNTDSIEHYIEAVLENRSPVKKHENISADRAFSEAIFLGLRKTGGINIESLSRRYNINILSRYNHEIEYLREAGLIEITCSGYSYETNLKLTKKGLILSNEVFARFI
jgi:oxygen-independent coproporphyrinogen-3 oxidase